MNCRCHVQYTGGLVGDQESYRIDLCPLHAAAEELLKAHKEIVDLADPTRYAIAFPVQVIIRMKETSKRAIAEAEKEAGE